MESTLLRRPLTRPAPLEVGLAALVIVLAGAAWVLTGERMAGMDAGPGTNLGAVGWFVGVWVTMMAAMMFPSITPIVLAHARLAKGGRAATVFVAGYLLAWAVAGLGAYMVIEGVRDLDLGLLAWDELGPYVAGAVVFLAALYQLSPLKDSCLRECRSPQTLLQHWRPGYFGALRMGLEHGGFCIGCCWALMAALFALGVMSVGWMVFIAALIAVEKLLPWKTIASRGIAVVLAVLALAVAFTPADVPSLTIPGSPDAMEAMGMEPDRGKPMRGSESMGGSKSMRGGEMGDERGR